MTYRWRLAAIVLSTSLITSLVDRTTSVVYADTLTVAAANSLRETLRGIMPEFERAHPEISVRVVYGPSQTLRTQIEQGAPIDAFMPSSTEELDHLEGKGLTVRGSTRIYAGTSLVLITSADVPAAVTTLADLEQVPFRRLALGDPQTSAVGKVAAQYIASRNLAPTLRSRILFGEHSRAVLDLVAKGEAELGLVYRTDAVASTKIRVLDTAPPSTHQPVRYGIASVWTAKNLTGSLALADFLLTPGIQALLQNYGFDRFHSESTASQQGKDAR
ncbi:MAG: molybdate ABC transporter substrate-binding protein [Nitrospiraceae bacterium]